jgi:hypothetical protein
MSLWSAFESDRDEVGSGLRVVLRDDEDVPGLQVAVDDPLLVRVLDGVAHARDELEPLSHRELALARVPAERLAVDELHREKRLRPRTRVGGARLVDLRDARVLEQAENFTLALEALQPVRRGDARLQDLERDEAARLLLLGLDTLPIPPSPIWRRIRYFPIRSGSRKGSGKSSSMIQGG